MEVMEKISVRHMTNAHTDWLRGLEFYKQELKILKNRLTEIAGKHRDPEVMKDVEHFENQFEIQAENIHRLTHDIKANARTAGMEYGDSGPGYVDGMLLDKHYNLGERFASEEKTIQELRYSFNEFASAWL